MAKCEKCGEEFTGSREPLLKEYHPEECPGSPEERIKQAWRKLIEWQPGALPPYARKEAKAGGYYDKEDEKAPFFSEAYLYNTLGKDDARTLRAYMRRLAEALGLPSRDF